MAAGDRIGGVFGRGVAFTEEPVDRFGSIDEGFRDPAGNGWKRIRAAGK